MRIHRAGYRVIILTAVILAVIDIFLFLLFDNTTAGLISSLLSVVILVFIMAFFRKPDRKIINGSSYILSAADGKVVAIEEVEEKEYFRQRMLQISVFMSIYNVHINRHPVSGTINYLKHHKGRYFIARNPKSSEYNERSSIIIKSDEGPELMVRQIAGAVARRVVTFCKEKDKVKQGDELGFIKFGSRVDLFLPVGIKPLVKLNQEVRAGIDIIAEI